jgi:hypothetical protein
MTRTEEVAQVAKEVAAIYEAEKRSLPQGKLALGLAYLSVVVESLRIEEARNKLDSVRS